MISGLVLMVLVECIPKIPDCVIKHAWAIAALTKDPDGVLMKLGVTVVCLWIQRAQSVPRPEFAWFPARGLCQIGSAGLETSSASLGRHRRDLWAVALIKSHLKP